MELAALVGDLALLALEIGDGLSSESWVAAAAGTEEVDAVVQPRSARGERSLLLAQLRELRLGVRACRRPRAEYRTLGGLSLDVAVRLNDRDGRLR